MENWLSIVVGVYLLSMVLYGHYRGFIRLVVSVAALIAALTIVHVSMPKVTEYLNENTTIRQTLTENMKKAAGLASSDTNESEESNIEEGHPEGSNTEEGLPAMQRLAIENMELPQSLKKALIENNNSEVYELLGVNAFADYVGSYLADLILNTVGSVILFAVVYLVIRLVVRWLDLIARLPILSGMNKLAGALLGGVEGILFLWILCLVVTACSGTSWGMILIRQIEASKWLTFLYENNLLNAVFLSMLHGIF